MSTPGRSSFVRRAAQAVLWCAALGMLGMVGFVFLTDESDRWPGEATEDAPVVNVDNPPAIDFPDDLRTYDLSLNQAIDRFIRVTRQGRYNDFRQLWTRREDPISVDKYKAVWIQLKEAHIREVKRPVPPPAGLPDAYLVRVEVKRETPAPGRKKSAELRLLATREAGEWVFELYSPARPTTTAPAPTPAATPADIPAPPPPRVPPASMKAP